MELVKDLGMIFASQESKQKTRHGVYKCPACGEDFIANTNNVNYGKTTRCRSCHPSKRCNIRKHKWYQMWANEKHRCRNKSNRDFINYGGRGIKFSEEFSIVENWILYVGSLENAGAYGYTIDRIDNNGNYEKGNLRWASKSTQSINRRKLKGKTSTYRGIFFRKDTKKYVAKIEHKGKSITIINSINEVEAARAYDKYIKENGLPHILNFE